MSAEPATRPACDQEQWRVVQARKNARWKTGRPDAIKRKRDGVASTVWGSTQKRPKSKKCLQTAKKSASIHTNQTLLSSNRLELSPWSFTHVLKKIETTTRWNCKSKALRFLQITAEHEDCPFFAVFLTIKTLYQNISITLLQISLKLYEHRGHYWRKKLLWTILAEQFPVPRNTAASKIGSSVISLLWQLQMSLQPWS